MISAVLVFGVEKKESTRRRSPSAPRRGDLDSRPDDVDATPTTAPPPAGGQGDPVAGKRCSPRAGCGGCHTLKAAGSTGNVGPNLDQLKPGAAIVTHQVEVGGGADAGVQGPR